LKYYAGLEFFFDEIVVECFFVGDDAHGAVLSGCSAGMLESRILQDSWSTPEDGHG